MIHFILFVLGLIFGSFFHVVFLRRDWYKGRSRCDICNYRLRWYDNIPIVSYTVLRGKCRNCKSEIKPTHIYAEILTGCTFLCASLCFDHVRIVQFVLTLIGLLTLNLSAIEDMMEQYIYSWILYVGIVSTTLVKTLYFYLEYGYEEALLMVLSVIGLLLLFGYISKFTRGKVGDGDFDLTVLIYVICGGIGALYSIFFASFIGCAIFIPKMIMGKFDKDTPIPFAPLMLLGTICFLMLERFYT